MSYIIAFCEVCFVKCSVCTILLNSDLDVPRVQAAAHKHSNCLAPHNASVCEVDLPPDDPHFPGVATALVITHILPVAQRV